MKNKSKTAYIIGAGFSKNAGIPLQSEFLDAIFGKGKWKKKLGNDAVEKIISAGINCYVERLFGSNPSLEDVFTCLDLSANTGHHLSSAFTSYRLRSVRRTLIARIFNVLNKSYKRTRTLKGFFDLININNANFVCLNWDTVVERELIRKDISYRFDYGCKEISYRKNKIVDDCKGPIVRIAKVHGSINWLYCDNCRAIYKLNPIEEPEVPRQILRMKDINVMKWITQQKQDISYKKTSKFRCKKCRVTLGTRLATFSFRKVLDAPMLVKSWFLAEELLAQADNWVFIGYSLPSADYEFKYLLKRLELSNPHGKKITVVTKDDGAEYKKFFGNLGKTDILTNGLEGYVQKLRGEAGASL